jgi:hypothetical protein
VASESQEDDGLTPISDQLMTELSAHRTLGLRQALGERPDVFLAALHALTLKLFYHYGASASACALAWAEMRDVTIIDGVFRTAFPKTWRRQPGPG